MAVRSPLAITAEFRGRKKLSQNIVTQIHVSHSELQIHHLFQKFMTGLLAIGKNISQVQHQGNTVTSKSQASHQRYVGCLSKQNKQNKTLFSLFGKTERVS